LLIVSCAKCNKIGLYFDCHDVGCRYAECLYAECRGAFCNCQSIKILRKASRYETFER
jgi:hypothetical protein